MSCIAIIPARAGSKGVVGKNVKLLGDAPLIAYNIKALLEAQHIDRVIVSTDGDEIADVSKAYGAEVIRRPVSIAGDMNSSEKAILHVLDELGEAGELPDMTCFSQCTSPFTASEDYDCGVSMMETGAYDCVFAVSDFHSFVWKKDADGQAVGLNHDKAKRRLMRQERDKEYLETGAFYLFNTKEFIEHKNRFFGRIGLYEMPQCRVFEIDTPDDFKRAELLCKDV